MTKHQADKATLLQSLSLERRAVDALLRQRDAMATTLRELAAAAPTNLATLKSYAGWVAEKSRSALAEHGEPK